jgi:hypothetical protein
LSKRRSLLLLAAQLSLAAAVYSFIWAYYIRSLPQGKIGVVFRQFSPEGRRLDLIRVAIGSFDFDGQLEIRHVLRVDVLNIPGDNAQIIRGGDRIY